MNTAIMIASPSPQWLGTWAQGLEDRLITTASSLDRLYEELVRRQPEVLLLDLALPGMGTPMEIAPLLRRHAGMRIVALGTDGDDHRELALFRIGVRGCCRDDIAPSQLAQIVAAVMRGELWIRRTLTPRLLDELGARLREESEGRREAVARLQELTRREREIADLVGNGESNKEIARRLDITERTVKAHLTEIFRKLRIGDRLKLALLITEAPMC
ncbi:LuxR C-terminal-related transcriptional regulator [Noviherbaspirillum pedocola]|uniref:Response regulator transcription factor n=1 Tax=Noviherbaspirillum pedocola TaxID=2801341 RepID=A0A934SW08_9BURK|nr:response regulator transcription factor [Noviherbaspirillum pedocola]MBK4733832.1 response regulator transcription factor [Noviherbaspirillum pedocola]